MIIKEWLLPAIAFIIGALIVLGGKRRTEMAFMLEIEYISEIGSMPVGRSIFNPSEFYNIKAAYFEVCANVEAGQSATCVLRNWTDDQNIANSEITFTEIDSVVKRSADIKNKLPKTPKELTFRLNALSGAYLTYKGSRLVIIQG